MNRAPFSIILFAALATTVIGEFTGNGSPKFKARISPRNPQWQEVCTVPAGQKARFIANGNWKVLGSRGVGPVGNPGEPKAGAHWAAPGLNEGALLVKIEGGPIDQFKPLPNPLLWAEGSKQDHDGSPDMGIYEVNGPCKVLMKCNEAIAPERTKGREIRDGVVKAVVIALGGGSDGAQKAGEITQEIEEAIKGTGYEDNKADDFMFLDVYFAEK